MIGTSTLFATASLSGLAGIGVAAAKSVTGSSATDVVILVAAVLTALGVIARMLHLPELRRGTRDFLRTWNGEAKRPGVEAVPGIPEQMADTRANLTTLTADMHQIKGAMPSLAQALTDLAGTTNTNGQKIDMLEKRQSDHRQRNDEQAALLRMELDRRAEALERKLEARNRDVDTKLDGLAEDVFRAQAGRAILHELGMKIEPADGDPLAPKDAG